MLGLFSTPRALTVRSSAIPLVAGQPALIPVKLEGTEGINSLFDYRLTLQTPDTLNFKSAAASNLDLDSFIGLELTCHIELEGHGHFVPGVAGGSAANQDAGVREISGLITSARFVGEDNRHAVYELTLRPWLHLATLTTDCKVFQDQTPVEVIEAVLTDYPFAADKRLLESYPTRDYCVQYNETDFEFITRLMQEWGINYHFEHSGGVHRLIWSDHNGAFHATGHHSIPFYPLGHKIDQEYIHGFSPVERITSGSYATRDYDYTRPRATLTADAAAPRDTGKADQDVYLWRVGSDYSQPNAGADKQANQTEAQGQQLALLRMQILHQSGLRAQGVGHVRSIVPGCSFVLSGHPQEKANAEYITLHTHFEIENVGEKTQRLEQALQGLTGEWRVLVAFQVQPSTEVLRPEYLQAKPKTGGPETALVVGPGADTAESNIYTDSLGRIKVQFPWDRYGQKNQNSSCWVRVSSTWAGNQLGAMHVPRIGEEVVVNFLGGDPDLPVASARVYNQLNMPPWSLPQQQALSGLRSRELIPGGGNSAAGRSNHLVLDDTEQKIQVQLKSDHQHSSLSLGHISRIEDNAGRKDWRGEGFELRTDGHGVVRAKGGLLISTEARSNAQAHAKDMGETTARLSQAQDLHDSLSDMAVQHQAQDADVHTTVSQDIQAQNQSIQGQRTKEDPFPELADPHIAIASPAGIASTTPGSTHHHSGRQHAITSGGHTSISSNKSLLVTAKDAVRLFAYKSGMKLISAASDIHINALQTSIRLLAKMDISLTANSIALTANKQVLVNGGGSYMKWNAGTIEEGSAGTRTVHAPSYPAVGADNSPVVPVVMPTGELAKVPPGEIRVQLKHLPDESPLLFAMRPYTLFKNGTKLEAGVTDAHGFVIIERADLNAHYAVQLTNGSRFDLPVQQTFAAANTQAGIEHRLSNQGVRADGQSTEARYWPRGTTYGDLLAEKAVQGVKVRLLLWFATGVDDAIDGVVSMLAGSKTAALSSFTAAAWKRGWQEKSHNADIPVAWMPMPGFAEAIKAPRVQIRNAKATDKAVRDAYVAAWWQAALGGNIKNLEVRFREASPTAIAALKGRYLPTALSAAEELSIATVGTHHQKPILIDYHPGQGIPGTKPHTCGYVMGLNSVTDYWDSDKHLYNDPRRETAYGVGADWLAPWHLKPYRDYAIRVEGEALACLNRNFCSAWDKAKATHVGSPGKPLLQLRSAIKPPQTGGHRAQIVRTQPEDGDATILKTYTQATSNALNYIYIENQYVQLEHWVNFVKGQRKEQLKAYAEGLAKFRSKYPQANLPDKPPPLFVFVVMPQAELDQMIPSTYATLTQMGQATTVRGYHAQVQDLAQGKDPGVGYLAKAVLKDTLASTPSTGSVAAELNQLGIKTLTAMLMTYDYDNQADKLRINKRDNAAQEAQAEQERNSAKKHASDEAPGEYSQHNIQPQRYREIYIHSKLMLIDDVFTTLGSANLNKRSMAGDSELNIAVPDYYFTKAARQRVWGNLAGADLDGGDGSPQKTLDTFEKWNKRMLANAKSRTTGIAPIKESFIHTYDDPRGAPVARLA